MLTNPAAGVSSFALQTGGAFFPHAAAYAFSTLQQKERIQTLS